MSPKPLGGKQKMNNELMIPVEISVKDKQRSYKGKAVRASMYARSKVIHVQTEENENFYLIFYRSSFVYGGILDNIDEAAFIHRAFCDGIVIESPNPVLSAFIPKKTVSLPNRNKLFSQLQSHFSPQEIAYISTTLDSFFEKEYLVKVIEQIYFDYKRNGKFMKAFQILQILTAFMPSLKSANERLSSREFYACHDFYQPSNLPSIYEKDPFYVELYCFKNRSQPDIYPIFDEILRKKECFEELILLWLEKIEKLQKVESIEQYTNIALKFMTLKEWCFTLARVKTNPFRMLPEASKMILDLMNKGNYSEAAMYLMAFMDDLPKEFDPILKELWKNLDPEFVVSHLEQFISTIQRQSMDGNVMQPETQIFQLVVNMLKGYELQTVHNKLLPLKKVLPHSTVLRKLNKMAALLEDPDRMMELGDDYAEFQQYDSAIDCYFWEMELKPSDPEPVRKLCKMYLQKGLVKEAAAYQKVFAELKNSQEIN